MKTIYNYTIRTADIDDKLDISQYYNYPQLIEYKGKKALIGAGRKDSMTVCIDDDHLYLLSSNYSLDYAGLQVFDSELELVGECFFDGEWKFEEMELKKSFFDYSEINQIKILNQYCEV